MIGNGEDRSASEGPFGLWHLLAVVESSALASLGGERTDETSIRRSLETFRREELPSARRTLQLVVLAAAEIRALMHDADGLGEDHETWSDDGDVEEAVGDLRLRRPPGDADALVNAQRSVRQTLGFVAGSISLTGVGDLKVGWLVEGLAGLQPARRRSWLRRAADLVLWSGATVLLVIERMIAPPDDASSNGSPEDLRPPGQTP